MLRSNFPTNDRHINIRLTFLMRKHFNHIWHRLHRYAVSKETCFRRHFSADARTFGHWYCVAYVNSCCDIVRLIRMQWWIDKSEIWISLLMISWLRIIIIGLRLAWWGMNRLRSKPEIIMKMCEISCDLWWWWRRVLEYHPCGETENTTNWFIRSSFVRRWNCNRIIHLLLILNVDDIMTNLELLVVWTHKITDARRTWARIKAISIFSQYPVFSLSLIN